MLMKQHRNIGESTVATLPPLPQHFPPSTSQHARLVQPEGPLANAAALVGLQTSESCATSDRS